MSNLCRLSFTVTCSVPDEYAEELGKELAEWLQESWFNGEDVLEVTFSNYEIIR